MSVQRSATHSGNGCGGRYGYRQLTLLVFMFAAQHEGELQIVRNTTATLGRTHRTNGPAAQEGSRGLQVNRGLGKSPMTTGTYSDVMSRDITRCHCSSV
jgi:hypothetical protein